MSVNWSWKDKMGEVVWVNKNNPEDKFSWNIYHANCLGCMLYEWQEDGKDMYKFITYFNDVHHMKRMLGLESFKSYGDGPTIKEDWFGELYVDYVIDYIKIDPSYIYADKYIKYFSLAGYEVRVKKEEKQDDKELESN